MKSEEVQRRQSTEAIIHLDALRHNVQQVRKALAPGTRLCAAVKGDAYGHGAVRIARELRKQGVHMLGVATPHEGMAIRQSGDTHPILLLGICPPETIGIALESDLMMVVSSRDQIDNILDVKKKIRTSIPATLHLKIDTGMGRIGCTPQEARPLAQYIRQHPELHLGGVATHFSVSDSPRQEDIQFTQQQAHVFRDAVESIRKAGIHPGLVHAANTGAIFQAPDLHFDMVRTGIALYGYGPRVPHIEWHPVMELRTCVGFIKKIPAGTPVSYGRTWTAPEDTWIASLRIGYADGYPRLLSNKAFVCIQNKRYPIVGTICMDQCMVNLGPQNHIDLYQEVTLMGPGTNQPDANELAKWAHTIPYEILTRITSRVPRIYS